MVCLIGLKENKEEEKIIMMVMMVIMVVVVEVTMAIVMMVMTIDDGCGCSHDSCDKDSHNSGGHRR